MRFFLSGVPHLLVELNGSFVLDSYKQIHKPGILIIAHLFQRFRELRGIPQSASSGRHRQARNVRMPW